MADDVDVTSSDAVVEASAAAGGWSFKTVVVDEDPPGRDFDLFFLNASKSARDGGGPRGARGERRRRKDEDDEDEGDMRDLEDEDMDDDGGDGDGDAERRRADILRSQQRYRHRYTK